jgi:hypothetical protein
MTTTALSFPNLLIGVDCLASASPVVEFPPEVNASSSSSSLTCATIRFHGLPLTVTTTPFDSSSLKDGLAFGESGSRNGYVPGNALDIYGGAPGPVNSSSTAVSSSSESVGLDRCFLRCLVIDPEEWDWLRDGEEAVTVDG